MINGRTDKWADNQRTIQCADGRTDGDAWKEKEVEKEKQMEQLKKRTQTENQDKQKQKRNTQEKHF